MLMKSAQYHPCEVGETNYLHTGKWSAQDKKEAHSKWNKPLSSALQADLPLCDDQPINPLNQELFSLLFASTLYQNKACKTEH